MADLPPLPTPFTVVIDQREKLPFDFGDLWSDAKEGSLILAVSTKLGHLPSGDYSLEGCEAEIAIERKSLADLYSTIGQHRDRFEREIERLDRMTFALIVVEEDWRSILTSIRPRHHCRGIPLAAERVAGTPIMASFASGWHFRRLAEQASPLHRHGNALRQTPCGTRADHARVFQPNRHLSKNFRRTGRASPFSPPRRSDAFSRRTERETGHAQQHSPRETDRPMFPRNPQSSAANRPTP